MFIPYRFVELNIQTKLICVCDCGHRFDTGKEKPARGGLNWLIRMVVHCLDYFDNPVVAADTLAAVARYIAAAAAVGIAVVEPAVAVVADCQYEQNLAWRHESQ
ncbi:hypothetical protein NVP1042O_66 [Vibrio phage 1.042.O._10N.286.45.B8]|nr:hypothetical protein NVP1042O_66 [Vibrio phage 1.042.O._10N.286.45.B8]